MGSEDQGNTEYSFKIQSYQSLHIKSKSCSLLVCLRLGTEIFFHCKEMGHLCYTLTVMQSLMKTYSGVKLVKQLKTGKIRTCLSLFWRILANVHMIIFI